MIFSHSWNERRLRRQITGQIRRKQSKSKFKRLLIIALALFAIFILYTKLTANENNQSLSTKPQVSESILRNYPALDANRSNSSTHAGNTESIPKVHRKEEKTTSNTKGNANQSPSFQTIASIDANEKNDKKQYSTFELNSQEVETLESLYKERLNGSNQ